MNNQEYKEYCRHMNEDFVNKVVQEHLEDIENGNLKRLDCGNSILHFFTTDRRIITTIEFKEVTPYKEKG